MALIINYVPSEAAKEKRRGKLMIAASACGAPRCKRKTGTPAAPRLEFVLEAKRLERAGLFTAAKLGVAWHQRPFDFELFARVRDVSIVK